MAKPRQTANLAKRLSESVDFGGTAKSQKSRKRNKSDRNSSCVSTLHLRHTCSEDGSRKECGSPLETSAFQYMCGWVSTLYAESWSRTLGRIHGRFSLPLDGLRDFWREWHTISEVHITEWQLSTWFVCGKVQSCLGCKAVLHHGQRHTWYHRVCLTRGPCGLKRKTHHPIHLLQICKHPCMLSCNSHCLGAVAPTVQFYHLAIQPRSRYRLPPFRVLSSQYQWNVTYH